MGSLALAVAFTLPLWSARPLGTLRDWDYALLSQWTARSAVARFQAPLWTPYVCGGMPLLGNPQSRAATPFFLLHLVFGVDVGFRLELLLHLALAAAGSYVLARNVGLSRTGSVVSALVFPTCSFHYAHFAVGHAALALPFLHMPWPPALALHALATRKRWPLAMGGAFMAMMLGEGGAYPFAYTGLTLGGMLGARALALRDARPLRALGVLLVFALAFATVKLLPMVELVQVNDRRTSGPDGFHPLLMLRALFARDQDLTQRHRYQIWDWHEYSAYVSPAFAGLGVIGAILAVRRSWTWTICAACFLLLAVGNFYTFWEPRPRPLESPWTLLHRLPPFSSLRVPARFLVVFVLCVGVLAGYGFDALAARLTRMRLHWTALLVAISVADAWWVGARNLEYAFDADARGLPSFPSSAPFVQYRDTTPPLLAVESGASTRMHALATGGYGIVNCYDPIRPRPAVIAQNDPGYDGEYRLIGEGAVSLARFSINELSFSVDAPEGGTVVVNQNFDPHFRVTAGRGLVTSSDGRLAVTVPPGKQKVALAYRCRSFEVGALVCLLAALTAFWLWRREQRRPGALLPSAPSST